MSAGLGIELPEEGRYAVGFLYLSPDEAACSKAMSLFEGVVNEEGQSVLGWRDVPVKSEILGADSRSCEPLMKQIFIGRSDEIDDDQDFERKLYVIRRRASDQIRYSGLDGGDFFYSATLSARTIVYKGMLTTGQLGEYFTDLHHPDMESAMALVHSRFSTNTFPSWPRAQPFRYMSHNGEINTLRGNVNWMNARKHIMTSKMLNDDLKKINII